MSESAMTKRHSAQGTRLNKRGVASRRKFIDAAIEVLATEGPAGASANLVAKRAGATWGTVQHQFGDADGLWAAVLDDLSERILSFRIAPTRSGLSVRRRVRVLIELLWRGFGSRDVRAAESLRLALPRSPKILRAEYPLTAAACKRFDAGWQTIFTDMFSDLDVSRTRLRRVRSLIPGALRGLRIEADMTGYADADEGVACLIDAVVAYLEPSTE